jgi:hypothetical protein
MPYLEHIPLSKFVFDIFSEESDFGKSILIDYYQRIIELGDTDVILLC